MRPDLRAIVDRFMYEQATVRHMVAAAPADAGTRVVSPDGMTVAQAVAHLAGSQRVYAATIRAWLAGETPPTAAHAHAPDEGSPAPTLGEGLGELGLSLRDLFAAFQSIPDDALGSDLGGLPAIEVIGTWAAHYLEHGYQLSGALPETRYDPLTVNWLGRAPAHTAELREAQRRYIQDARDHFAAHDEGPGDDHP